MTVDDTMLEYVVLPGSPALRTLTLEGQIKRFEDTLRSRIFQPVHILLSTNNPDVDIAALAILNAIPEMLAQLQGYANESPTDHYRRGIEYIFPQRGHNVFDENELIQELMYGKLRSGIAHFAFVGERILLARDKENLSTIIIDKVDLGHMPGWTYFPPCMLSVNVPEWYAQIKKRVGDYISDLRDPTNDDLRSKFSERITRGDAPRKGEPTDCMCGPTRFCVRCADVKLPNSHIDARSVNGN